MDKDLIARFDRLESLDEIRQLTAKYSLSLSLSLATTLLSLKILTMPLVRCIQKTNMKPTTRVKLWI